MEGTILQEAKLLNTDLRQANLKYSQLAEVDFSQCRVEGAVFTDAMGLSRKQKLWLKANGALNV